MKKYLGVVIAVALCMCLVGSFGEGTGKGNPNQKSTEALLKLAITYTGGDLAAASSLIHELPLEQRDDLVVSMTRVECLRKQGGFTEYARLVEALTEKFPNNARVVHELAKIQIRKGGTLQAVVLLRRAVTLDPLYAAPYYDWATLSTDKAERIRLCSYALLNSEPKSELARKVTELLKKDNAF